MESGLCCCSTFLLFFRNDDEGDLCSNNSCCFWWLWKTATKYSRIKPALIKDKASRIERRFILVFSSCPQPQRHHWWDTTGDLSWICPGWNFGVLKQCLLFNTDEKKNPIIMRSSSYPLLQRPIMLPCGLLWCMNTTGDLFIVGALACFASSVRRFLWWFVNIISWLLIMELHAQDIQGILCKKHPIIARYWVSPFYSCNRSSISWLAKVSKVSFVIGHEKGEELG